MSAKSKQANPSLPQASSLGGDSRKWIPVGTSFSAAAALLFMLRGRWRLARIAGGFAAAFALKWRDDRLSRELAHVLTQAGRTP